MNDTATKTEAAALSYHHEGGKGGDEQIVYFADSLGFQYDESTAHYRSTAQRAEEFLIGAGYTVTHE